MDDTPPPPNPSHSKASLPTFARSIPLEIAALPASTRTSFTRVDDTRPGTAAGDTSIVHNHLPPDGGGGSDGADADADAGDARNAPQPPRDELEEEDTGAVVPQETQALVQFLLVSGRRRSMAFDPETTVGRVKELVWNTWPNGTLSLSFVPTPLSLHTYTHMRAWRRLRHMVHKVCRCGAAAATHQPDSIVNVFHFHLFKFYFILLRAELLCQFLVDVWDFSSFFPWIDDRFATTDWQDEHPPAPSHLRVLYLGRILQDDETLTRMCFCLYMKGGNSCSFPGSYRVAELNFPCYTPPEPATPTIVHLSIRSFVPREDTSLKKKKRRMSRSLSNANANAIQAGMATPQDDRHGSSCCCVIC